MPKRDPNVGKPSDWMRFAYDDFLQARDHPGGLSNLAGPCFHAQQAVEKALKGVCMAKGVKFGIVHDLAILEELLEANGVETSEEVYNAIKLSSYATARYPGDEEDPPTQEDLAEAILLAHGVLEWAVTILGMDPFPDTPAGV